MAYVDHDTGLPCMRIHSDLYKLSVNRGVIINRCKATTKNRTVFKNIS